ncbi:MAG: SOS response-associated peptidase [Cyanobacteria bacterium P01_H01_bin.58]
MCGRYYFKGSVEELQGNISFATTTDELSVKASYNIAPSQTAPVIRATAKGAELVPLKWGLIPHWAKDRKAIKSQINARSETAHEKPFFRDALRLSRCLIPADGFFEWQRDRDRKRPYCIGLTNDETFCFAGLWAKNTKGEILETFTILTCTPNPLMQSIHNRMPVILQQKDYGTWLSGSIEAAGKLLKPYPESRMKTYAISDKVNNPRNDDPSILQAI